jgi:hypothetical protein
VREGKKGQKKEEKKEKERIGIYVKKVEKFFAKINK